MFIDQDKTITFVFRKKINNANNHPTNENYKFFGKQLSP